MIAIWWPNGRERWRTRIRGSAVGQAVEDGGGGVRRPVVDDHELVREVCERGRDAAAELRRQPFLVEHWRHHAEQAQLAGGHGRRECRATATIRCRDARPRKHPPAADRLLPLVPGAVPRRLGLSWGTSIIALTLLVRAMLLPVTYKSSKSMIRLQQLAPQMKSMQKKYKEDPQRLQQETMKFYRENSVNPFASCLPMVAQLPVFLSLYYMLRVDLRHDICPRDQHRSRRQAAKPLRRDAGVELALHPRPDRQGHGLGAGGADHPLRRLAARVDAADVGHRRQEPADDLPRPAVPVRRVHLAVPGRPAPLLDHDQPLDDPAAVDHQEAPRAAARGSRGGGEGAQGADGARGRQGQGQEGRQVG